MFAEWPGNPPLRILQSKMRVFFNQVFPAYTFATSLTLCTLVTTFKGPYVLHRRASETASLRRNIPARCLVDPAASRFSRFLRLHRLFDLGRFPGTRLHALLLLVWREGCGLYLAVLLARSL